MTRRMLLEVDGRTHAVETSAETPLVWILSWVMQEPRLLRIENEARALAARSQAAVLSATPDESGQAVRIGNTSSQLEPASARDQNVRPLSASWQARRAIARLANRLTGLRGNRRSI